MSAIRKRFVTTPPSGSPKRRRITGSVDTAAIGLIHGRYGVPIRERVRADALYHRSIAIDLLVLSGTPRRLTAPLNSTGGRSPWALKKGGLHAQNASAAKRSIDSVDTRAA